MYEFIRTIKTITSTDVNIKSKDNKYCNSISVTTSPYDLTNYQHPNFIHYLDRTRGVF